MEFVIYLLIGWPVYTLIFYVLDRILGQREPRSLNRILGVLIFIGLLEVVIVGVHGADALNVAALLIAYLASMFTLNAFYRWRIKNESKHDSPKS